MSKKNKIFKIIIAIVAIAILSLIVIYLFPILKQITTKEGQIAFKQTIDELGIWGMLLLFCIQIVQIFFIIIPGEPIEILAGMCYGALGGLIFIMITSAIITAMIVFLVRLLGRKFVYNFFSEERINKIEKSKMFKNTKRLEWIMIILFLIPGTPKDLIVYISALLPINPYRFVIISVIARIPSIISSTLAGANLAVGNWELSILIYLITFAIIGIVILIVNKLDKSKATKDVLESIK